MGYPRNRLAWLHFSLVFLLVTAPVHTTMGVNDDQIRVKGKVLEKIVVEGIEYKIIQPAQVTFYGSEAGTLVKD